MSLARKSEALMRWLRGGQTQLTVGARLEGELGEGCRNHVDPPLRSSATHGGVDARATSIMDTAKLPQNSTISPVSR